MANGGRPWTAAWPRRSEARTSRRSLTPRAATTMPADADGAGPGDRLGVDVGADDEDRAGPADVDLRGSDLAVARRR